MEKDTRSRKYLLTVNNPDLHAVSHGSIKEALKKYAVKYLAICDETGGEKQTYHFHAYIYFENAIKFSTLKKLFPAANIVTVRGTSAENKMYLLKAAPEHNKKEDGSYRYTDAAGKVHFGINHSDTFEEIGECPDDHPGKRTDLENMYQLIKDGYTNSEILEMCGEVAIMHIEKLNKLRHAYLIDKFKGSRRLNLRVHYVSGLTGRGKTRDRLDRHGDENCYRITDYMHPFDSYQCEEILVFEEYRSSLKLQDMLNYLDIYPVVLPARYAPKVACYLTVYVVSNWDFELQYAELQKDPDQKSSYDAWVRRFNGSVMIYTDTGIVTYPTMRDYLKRNEKFRPLPPDAKTPFDDPDTDENYEQESMPFD